ncbi:sigma-70 family RNA polymerase sigma factor [Odoribacter sp. N15.MGS-14]|uniref:RNA polymerase sigma factor n=1 Tax=Odoribacter sp. N15.MGS-14 TaxID=1637502 RepID=UPI0006231671|nr:sigma-70 family RNA polymerase sigma factor [Odoribacter sp. N15.MGS-14]
MSEKLDIKDLGRRIKGRDEKAFRYLYVEYFHHLQSYAMRYTYDWTEAENIVQESFLSLWCNLHRYDAERNVITYLLTIVRNACLKYIRDLKIRDHNQNKVIEALLFSNMMDNEPDENLLRRLNEILYRLPDKQREVLLKHAVERKTLPEIALELGIAESTCKTHYKRAISLLRENLHFILFGL